MVRKDYEKLFSYLEPLEPPEDLSTRILARIHKERHFHILKWRLVVSVSVLVCAVIGFVPALQSLQLSFTETGSVQFLSLIFSDFGTIIPDWQSFGVAFLESLPIIGLSVFLAIVLVFFHSLKYVVRDFKVMTELQIN